MPDSKTTLSIAPYRKGALPLKLELGPVFIAEARVHEIAMADKARAKSLFADFIGAYIYTSKLHAMCKLHVARAATESRKRRSVLIIDFMPEMAKAKGLSTSRSPTGAEDIREAFLYRDEEFLIIEDGRAALEAAEAMMLGKMLALRDAADAVKQMLSPEDRPRLSNSEIQPNAYGRDANPDPMGAADPPPANTPVEGFDEPQH